MCYGPGVQSCTSRNILTWNSCSRDPTQPSPRWAHWGWPCVNCRWAERRDESLRCGGPGGHHKSTVSQSLNSPNTGSALSQAIKYTGYKTVKKVWCNWTSAREGWPGAGRLEGQFFTHPCFNTSVWVCHNETCQQIKGQLCRLCRDKLFLLQGMQQVTCPMCSVVVLADTANDVAASATSSHRPTAIFLEQNLCLPHVKKCFLMP